MKYVESMYVMYVYFIISHCIQAKLILVYLD